MGLTAVHCIPFALLLVTSGSATTEGRKLSPPVLVSAGEATAALSFGCRHLGKAHGNTTLVALDSIAAIASHCIRIVAWGLLTARVVVHERSLLEALEVPRTILLDGVLVSTATVAFGAGSLRIPTRKYRWHRGAIFHFSAIDLHVLVTIGHLILFDRVRLRGVGKVPVASLCSILT